MTETEIKLATYIIRSIIENHMMADNFKGVSELFLREMVQNKLNQILRTPLADSLASLRISITADNLIKGIENQSKEDFMKTMNTIIKNTIL